jgi:hypothetical protein
MADVTRLLDAAAAAALRLMPDPVERAAWERLRAEVEAVVLEPDRPAGS